MNSDDVLRGLADGSARMRDTEKLTAAFEAFNIDTELAEMREKAPWVWLQRSIDAAAAPSGESWRIITPELDQFIGDMAERFPGSLGIDFNFYGLTVLAGKAGSGKSILAIAVAIEAAAQGWRAIYFNTEMDRIEMRNRVLRCGVGRGDFLRNALGNFVALDVPTNATMAGAVAQLREQIRHHDRRVLLIVDSVNSFAEFLVRKDYDCAALNQLARVSNFVTRLRRVSLGDIAIIAVSELNAGGGVKGRKLEYSADVVLSIEAAEDDPSYVELNVTKNRSGPRPHLGRFHIDWQCNRLVPV